MLPNTAPFDVTGHPATSLSCGMSDGLPVGLGREAAGGRQGAAAGAHLTTIETMTMAAGALHAAPGQPTEAKGSLRRVREGMRSGITSRRRREAPAVEA